MNFSQPNCERANNRSGEDLTRKIARVRHLVRKEFIQIVRNKQNFRMLLAAPVFQLLLFGYAVRLDVNRVDTVVADLDRSTQSRSLIDAFSRSGYFVVTRYVSSYNEVDEFLERGDAKIAILIPPDFERLLQSDSTARVGVLIDGVDTITAGTVSGYVETIIQGFGRQNLEARLKRARGLRHAGAMPDVVLPSVAAAPRAWFNPNLDSKDYFVPGTLVLILTFFGITVPAMAIVRETERGTIEQIMVTPITKFELIVGKTTPCFVISVTNLAAMTGLAFLVFKPIFNGSIIIFFVAGVVFIVTCIGIGTSISVFCRTQQQAILSSFMVLQPCVILSGFVFPIENMPPEIQYLTYINPLCYFIVIVRQVFLKGIGWDILWPQFVPMAIIGLFFVVLSSLLFKKKID
jgi:ABC-2 type transport system permease protein